MIEFLLLLLIAAVAGSLGSALGGSDSGGLLGSILMGFVGAFIGTWLSRTLGLPEFLTFEVAGKAFPFVWAIIGSALLIAILRWLS